MSGAFNFLLLLFMSAMHERRFKGVTRWTVGYVKQMRKLHAFASVSASTNAVLRTRRAADLRQLAHVARTPWLDPCVAGGILALKALSEGDWRLGKGALASWADQGLRVATDMGAKALRLGSGDKVSRRDHEPYRRYHGRA